MRLILEKALIALLNQEQGKADALIHDFILERSRQIHESLRQGTDLILDENWEQELSIDEMFTEDDLNDGDDAGEQVDEADGNVHTYQFDTSEQEDAFFGVFDRIRKAGDNELAQFQSVDDVTQNGGKIVAVLESREGNFTIVSLDGKFFILMDHTAEGFSVEKLDVSSEQELLSVLSDADTAADAVDADDTQDDQFNEDDEVDTDVDVDTDSDDVDGDVTDVVVTDEPETIEDRVESLEDELTRLASEFDAMLAGEEEPVVDDEFAVVDTDQDVDSDVDSEVDTDDEDTDDEDATFESLGESIVDELENVDVKHVEGQTTSGAVDVDTKSRLVGVVGDKRLAGQPVKVKAQQHKGYDKEAAPKVATMKKRRNTQVCADDDLSPVAKEGDKSAILNDTKEDKSAQSGLFSKKV